MGTAKKPCRLCIYFKAGLCFRDDSKAFRNGNRCGCDYWTTEKTETVKVYVVMSNARALEVFALEEDASNSVTQRRKNTINYEKYTYCVAALSARQLQLLKEGCERQKVGPDVEEEP